jgi:2-polyprenyl-3-methyl-5-hydroxy-6-metoxy-1,4-benzoquinol methylase
MLEKMCAKKLDQNGRLSINLESAESLELIDEHNFDAAVAVNVAYALDDPLGCFRKVAQALKANGIFVLSTTHSETDLNPLLSAIESHLKTTGTLKEKEEHYRRVAEVNRDIQLTIARRYSREQYQEWLAQAGFEVTYEKSSYKDAVIVMHAHKM